MPKQNTITDEYKVLLQKIGENLAQARREKGMTQRDLAAKSEKNQTLIAKLEKYAPMDMSMRSIYEVIRHIPVSFSDFIAKAERDLELEYIPRIPGRVNDRLQLLYEKLSDLTTEEQVWMADMIDGLLSRTRAPENRRDKPDPRPQAVGA